jgi:hypothetical protein
MALDSYCSCTKNALKKCLAIESRCDFLEWRGLKESLLILPALLRV